MSIFVLIFKLTPFGIVTVPHCLTAARNPGASSPPLDPKVQDTAPTAKALAPDRPESTASIWSNFMIQQRKKVKSRMKPLELLYILESRKRGPVEGHGKLTVRRIR